MSTDGRWLGFDFSLLFDDPAICAAMAAYLVHRIDALLDGRRVMVLWDEIRYSLQIPLFAKIIEDFALRFRKQEAMLVLAAQEPGHITKAAWARSCSGSASTVSCSRWRSPRAARRKSAAPTWRASG